MKAKYDKMFLGLLAGVFAPTLVFFIVYIVKYMGTYSLQTILSQIQTLELTSKIIALCVFLANLLVFYLMYRLRWDKFCKGVLLATFIYAFLVISIKYF
ncbi:hypothetical protein C7377_0947 [Balneicella halophila]|uniref:Uncharacterized protein n=2 Tax=Balneicella halophila TaxID=1537566 RepID=A0A7L4US59_BALHA|nr:hypothetical protein C7377_0947 [Balneicella halophila]